MKKVGLALVGVIALLSLFHTPLFSHANEVNRKPAADVQHYSVNSFVGSGEKWVDSNGVVCYAITTSSGAAISCLPSPK